MIPKIISLPLRPSTVADKRYRALPARIQKNMKQKKEITAMHYGAFLELYSTKLRQDSEFKASLEYIMRLCQKNKSKGKSKRISKRLLHRKTGCLFYLYQLAIDFWKFSQFSIV